MFDALKRIFSPGLMSCYQVDAPLYRHQFYTITGARDRKTMRPVHIKTYSPEGLEFESKMDRLYRTQPLASVLPELRHEAILRTVDSEVAGDRRIEVLEPASGAMLRNRLDARDISPEEFYSIVTSVGRGLAYLHSKGFLHRGLAPEGIFAPPGGEVKITDLSLLMDISKAGSGGTVVGPVGYTAPEVIARRGADIACDIYSLGAIMYEMLTGVRLFPHARGYEGLLRLMNSRPEPVSSRNPGVSPELEAVVMKAVAKNPKDRYQSVEDLLADLSAAPLPEHCGNHLPAYAA